MKTISMTQDVRQKVRWGSGALLVLILGLFVFAKVFTPMAEDRSQALLEKEFIPALLNGVAPVGYPIEAGTSVALLEIKDINLRRVVVEGTRAEELTKGPGHLVGSAIPGQPGTSAILGRSSRYGSAFARLDELKAGQEVTVTTAQGVHTYEVVDSTVRSANDSAAFTGERNMLLLITGVGGASPDQRLVVRTLLTSPVFPAGTSATDVQTTTAELGLEGSTHSPMQLAIWLFLLLILLVSLIPLTEKIGKRVTWLIASPLIAVALFQVWHHATLMYPSIG
ncbi:MAG: sortase [Actinomycetes bacterium]